jgi:GH35 family endo-1,4-beta-xylanase
LQRIEDIRTAPIKINVIDKNGNAVKGAKAQIKLVEQEFIWGTAANEALLGNNLPNSKNYRKYLKEFFNTAIIENGFKAGTWQDKPFRKAETMRAFNWIQQNGFRQRGHNAVWPGWKFNSKLFKTTAETDTAKFRLMIEEDVRSKMLAIKGKVIAWDVINEPIHERNFQKYLPADIEVQWFKLAKEIDPLALLFINEYGMLNSIASPAFIRSYIDTIIRLRNSGAPIEAIGIQGHVGRQPRSPSQVISDLDMFKPLGLPVQITEFDINMTDEQLQADYTRDFLIACYSHPTITGFNIWGFWQGAHWKPDAAMFTNNWTEKLNAAVWREWVTKKWKTNITVTTNKMGMVNNKGHLGNYEVLINYKGKSKKVNYQLTKKSQPLVITIN